VKERRPGLLSSIPRQPSTLRLQAAATLLLAGVVVWGCDGKHEPPDSDRDPQPSALVGESADPVRGSWVAAERGTIRQFLPTVGTFRAPRVSTLGPQVSARVAEVLVDVGDRVERGQELLHLDPTPFEIEVSRQHAELDSARVALEEAGLQYQRMRNLWDKPEGEPSVPKKLYDEARLANDAAEARLATAEQGLADAERRLREAVIRAPYDGVVTKRSVDPGEVVSTTPPTELLEVQEISTLELEFSLPQELLLRVRKGTPVEYTLQGADGEARTAAIDVVYPDVDEATRSFRCRVFVPNADLAIRPGLLVDVRVLQQEIADAILVPRRALSETATGWKVLVSNDGHPTDRMVELGLMTEKTAELVAGIETGESVLVPDER